MDLKGIVRNKWVRMAFWSILYLLWIIWVGNWWWLFGLIVIFDHHITKKVKWVFWKKEYKEGEKHNSVLEWLDAIIFAVVLVTFINIFFFQAFKIPSSSMESTLYTGDHLFVSKVAFGPRLPQTVLSVPFTDNTIFGRESYSTLIQCKYRRIKGFRHVRRGDYVVFNFPNGDTVLSRAPGEDYYAACRQSGRDFIIQHYGPVRVRPADKKDHYVKRCVAVAGDTLEIRDGQVYINSRAQEVWPGVQMTYTVRTNGSPVNSRILEKTGVNSSEAWYDRTNNMYPALPLTSAQLEKIASCSNVDTIEANIDVYPPDYPDSYKEIFPFTPDTHWTRDNFGPLWIPAKGETVPLNGETLPFYERIITTYEHNTLGSDAGGGILVNGEKTETYTFQQDYYFMMGDNRHNSLDSRYWGFVPEDHIVGRPALVWLSTDASRHFPKNVRWSRFFKFL